MMYSDEVKTNILKFFRYSHSLKELEQIPNKLYSFTTITFDPSKFGYFNMADDEQLYILNTLKQLIQENIIEEVTGCFEYHKSGQTHAHMHIRSEYTFQYIDEVLSPYFTDNKKNKVAVKSYPAKFQRDEEYMTKESTEYFSYKSDIDKGVIHSPLVQANSKIEVIKPKKIDEETLNREKRLLSETKRRQCVVT